MTSDPAVSTEVSTEGREKPTLMVTERDIIFNCPSCQGQLVVDRAGEGIEVPCSHCGQPLTVPAFHLRPVVEPSPTAMAEPPTRIFDFTTFSAEQLQRRSDELQHQLKENRSQDTEMRGHVNRATMEVHRLQLRLKTLQERHTDIQAELAAIRRHDETDEP